MSNELTPLFPSATHPALPVASQILSTLRHLTAPGKGNELRPEERPALVGIAALLGCERVQNHDLAESSLQRLSSVSPARFKSALATSRRLLANAESASPTANRRKRPATSASPTSSPTKVDALSPFQTPKKKFKYTSGLDLTGLVHAHSPSKASPLKQSVTPSQRREKRAIADISDSDGEDVEATPTKRTAPRTSRAARTEPSSPRSARQMARKEKEAAGAEAFLALRPDTSAVPTIEVTEEDEATPRRSPVRRLVDEFAPRPTRRRRRKRMDWTFREEVWAAFDPEGPAWRRNRKKLDEILDRFEPAEEIRGGSADEIVYNAWKRAKERDAAEAKRSA